MEMMAEGKSNFTLDDSLFGSTTTTSQPNLSPFASQRLLHTAALVDYYYTPILCFLGAMGNCLSVTVFCFNANHRSLSSSYYLSALAISDTGFLINLFAFWLDGMGVGILSTNFGCPFVMFSGQVTCFLSVWLTVAFTVERFFAVCSPLTRPRICTKSKAKKVIFGLTAFALIAFSYVFFIAQVMENRSYADEYFDVNYDTKESNSTKEKYQMSEFTLPTMTGMLTPYGSNASFSESKGCFGERCLGKRMENGGGDDRNEFQEPILTKWDTLLMGIGNRLTFVSNASSPWISSNDYINGTQRLSSEHQVNPNISVRDMIDNSAPQFICTVPDKYMTISIVANYLDSMITLIVPFCLITFFNMRIAVTVWKLKDERQDIIAMTSMNTNSRANKKSLQTSTQHGVRDKLNRIIRSGVGEDSKSSKDKIHGAKQESKLASSGGMGFFRSITNKSGSICSSDSSNISGNEENDDRNPQRRCQSSSQLIKESNYNLNQSSSKINCNADNPIYNGMNLISKESGVERVDELQSIQPMLNLDREEVNKSLSSVTTDHQHQQPLLLPTQSQSKPSLLPSFGSMNVSRGLRRRGENKLSSSNSASEARVTKMLLLVSTVFLVLNLPSHALRAAAFIQKLLWEDDIEGQNRLYAAQTLANILLFNTNFAVNFLLYCLSGRNFRKSLWGIACRKQQRQTSSFHWKSGKYIGTNYKTTGFGSANRRNENETVVIEENVQFVVENKTHHNHRI